MGNNVRALVGLGLGTPLLVLTLLGAGR